VVNIIFSLLVTKIRKPKLDKVRIIKTKRRDGSNLNNPPILNRFSLTKAKRAPPPKNKNPLKKP